MRLIIIMMTTFLLQVSASSNAQKLTYVKQGATLNQIFQEIKKQTGFKVVYSNHAVDGTVRLNADFENEDINGVMEVLLKDKPLTFELDEKNIIIKVKEPSFLEKVVGVFQDINVSGRVVDADGRDLPGASVSVKGKGGKAVSTGANGSFYLKGVDEDAVLVISFIGYVNKEVKAAKELGDVVLELSNSKLDEVQVIAYGTTTQRLSTGNVTTIKADVIEKQPVNNPLLALQGRVPGLFIEQASGFAGTGVKVRIQGQNSINKGSEPFYVIDGVPYISQLLPNGNANLGNSGSGNVFGNPLSFINPSDIESIDVLKDADATAIYGSRAANGAILITTKKGKVGDMKVDLNIQSGWGKVPNQVDLLNTEQYLEMRKEALRNDGIARPSTSNFGDNDLNGNWDNSRNIDWQKELIGRNFGYNDITGSVSGGEGRTSFLVTGGYHNETNVFKGNYKDRKGSVGFGLNSISANQKFKIQMKGNYVNDVSKLPRDVLVPALLGVAPLAPDLYLENGEINWAANSQGGSTFFLNPASLFANEYTDKTTNLLSNMLLSYEVLPGLNIQNSLGYSSLIINSISKNNIRGVYPENLPYFRRGSRVLDSKINSYSIEPQLTFSKAISKGKLDVLLGTTITQTNSSQLGILANGFSSDLVMDDLMSALTKEVFSSINTKYKYNALFGRIAYNWQDKYLINLTARRDGSSRFGAENQFHNFGAFGAAWVFSKEHFVTENFPILTFGKLRGSYGTTGNDQIGDYQFLSLYTPVSQSVPYQGGVVYQPIGLTNPYLQWEETRKLQIGLDLGILSDQILINVNYYRNRSSNQLASYSLPNVTGFDVITKNLDCTIQNSGWESMITANIIRGTKFSWSSSANFTIPRNKLLSYRDLDKSTDKYRLIIGEPLNVVKTYHFLGVDPATGIYQFADKNGNPTMSPNDQEDRAVIIDPSPKLYGGITNTLNYKGFQLDVLFQFTKQKAQNDIEFGASGYMPGQWGYGLGNQPVGVLNRWKKPGDIANIQRFTTGYSLYQSYTNAAYYSDASWGDASYIRLKNVSLAWSVPSEWLRKGHLKSCNIFVHGQNLWTTTPFKGLDPETKSSSVLPPLRVITMGIKVGL
ncbi:SusC/RagA family TonB-linked outer membrane protein [Pedobacter foliorum]|uniref:SusC/RagA family TonB-linked outer membrane protein n=1 Tax=Pedobacter foliorum TaxID=2739058 RepID=UPI001563A373|nr:SusC/RagA family TonB-linked outer membrane protein [Pedobacter foliorum]NRF37579.1 SusC/RagA family TonB-linked outer membrane protein [Pedobacter foliorum]